MRADFAERSIEPVLAAVERQAGGYAIVRKLPGGAWGAWLVRAPDGSQAVLKCLWDADWRQRLASAECVVELLAARGAPVPRYLLSGYARDVGTWYVQECLSGERVEQLTPTVLTGVLALNGLQAGLADGGERLFDWSAHLARALDREAPGWLEAVRGEPEGTGVAERLEELIDAGRALRPSADDLVHGDLVATQLLADGGLTGVLDWDAAGCGDRGQDLALLLYNVFAQADRLGVAPNRGIVESLARRGLAVCGRARFGAYLAYEALSALSFVIERNREHVGWRIGLALRALAAFDAAARIG